ncbi:hypothetical protein POM88_052061 [Heracleum sosnowskyi]|uniref:Uncharacterized protein n=1 Tax=Heracleum sosnowskyi TaxID=360622 RepID=A0AAD8GTB6_9APIA|nr:hypothetical protein POM88_052061 [Heracleum sosnowskyi]
MLLDRSNTSVMVLYVSSIDNMRILMNLLRDSNKTIKLEAFHVFKLFAANQNKPPEIARNKQKRFFNDFHFDKGIELALSRKIIILFCTPQSNHSILMRPHFASEDEDFKSDKAQVVREIETLEPTTPYASPQR